MKARPSIAVCSPASLETLYFPFNYSPCTLPPLPHPHRSSWLPTAYVAPSPSVPLVFFFFFPLPSLHKTSWGRAWRGAGGGEAMEFWMVWGRRDSPLPRLQLCSVGGGVPRQEGLELMDTAKGPQLPSLGPTDFGRAKSRVLLGGWDVGKGGHWLLGHSPKYSLLFLGSPPPFQGTDDSWFQGQRAMPSVFRKEVGKWGTSSKIRSLDLPCNSIPNPQREASPSHPNSPICPNLESRYDQGGAFCSAQKEHPLSGPKSFTQVLPGLTLRGREGL